MFSNVHISISSFPSNRVKEVRISMLKEIKRNYGLEKEPFALMKRVPDNLLFTCVRK